MLFNNSEADNDMFERTCLCDCIELHERELMALAQVKVIGSSDEVHTVDALATTGEEGRGSLR